MHDIYEADYRDYTPEQLVQMFIEDYDGTLLYRDNSSWVIRCQDGKHRRIHTSTMEHFLNDWVQEKIGYRIHCGQSSPFKKLLQQTMVGRPRLSEWKHYKIPKNDMEKRLAAD